jgi:hypothetical protein
MDGVIKLPLSRPLAFLDMRQPLSAAPVTHHVSNPLRSPLGLPARQFPLVQAIRLREPHVQVRADWPRATKPRTLGPLLWLPPTRMVG